MLILTDDQRWDAMGCAGSPVIRTPAMDSLARLGVRFANAFVSTAVCSACRACLLTGRYGSASGVRGLGGGLRPGETTFVPLLKQAGYVTAFLGKWHLDPPGSRGDAEPGTFAGECSHAARAPGRVRKAKARHHLERSCHP